MSDEPKYFDPRRRLAEKAAARDQDDADLASGKRTAAEIQAENSWATGLDLKNARVHVPNPGAWAPGRLIVDGNPAVPQPVYESRGVWYRDTGLFELWDCCSTWGLDPPRLRREIIRHLKELGGTYDKGGLRFAFTDEATLRAFEARWLTPTHLADGAREVFERHSRPLLELIAEARRLDWPEVADTAATLHTWLMLRRQGDAPPAPTAEHRIEEHMMSMQADDELLRQTLAPRDPGELLAAINNLLLGYRAATGLGDDEIRQTAADAIRQWPIGDGNEWD